MSANAVWAGRRHETVSTVPWDAECVRLAAVTIARDAYEMFDEQRLWPMHPEDIASDDAPSVPNFGLYFGAAGVVSGLAALQRIAGPFDLARLARIVYRRALDTAPLGSAHAANSTMLGVAGAALAAGRYADDAEAMQALYVSAAASIESDGRDLMSGSPGFLTAARFAYEHTHEARWSELALQLAGRLVAELDTVAPEITMWTQHLYGRFRAPFLGAGHGLAGSAQTILAARRLLPTQIVEPFALLVARTVVATAQRTGTFVNWPAIYGLELRPGVDEAVSSNKRLQWCHGAPGIVTSLSSIEVGLDEAFDRLLVAAGETIWAAGPPLQDAGLCHGAAGNGYAFLKLYERTEDPNWLERARCFAMHALVSLHKRRQVLDRPWYSLWTGDIGTAVYFAACLDGDNRIPAIDRLP